MKGIINVVRRVLRVVLFGPAVVVFVSAILVAAWLLEDNALREMGVAALAFVWGGAPGARRYVDTLR